MISVIKTKFVSINEYKKTENKNNIDAYDFMKMNIILSNRKEQLFIYFLLIIVFIISIKGIYGIHYTTADDVNSEVYQDIFTFAEATEKGARLTYFLNSFQFQAESSSVLCMLRTFPRFLASKGRAVYGPLPRLLWGD